MATKIKMIHPKAMLTISFYKEYQNKEEVRKEWWENAKKIVDGFKEQQQIADYIRTNNTDLKKLRVEGALEGKEDITDGLE